MKRTACCSCSLFARILVIAVASAWVIPPQIRAAPATPAAPVSSSTAAPAADVSQISGAEVTKTGGVITGINIRDCKVLTEADYRLIRQTESLKSLSFAHGPDDASLAILAGMPAVEVFTTNGADITDAGLATLATFKKLRGLTFFHPGKGFTGTGLTALAVLPDLESFSVGGSLAFADPGMAAVGQLAHLKGFRTWHTGVTVEGVKSLGALKELKSVMIGQRLANKPPATLDDEAVAVLANITSLESLSLNEARLTLPALSKLAQIPGLKTLTLGGIDISESDISALKEKLPRTQIKWTPPDEGAKKRLDGIFGPAAASGSHTQNQSMRHP